MGTEEVGEEMPEDEEISTELNAKVRHNYKEMFLVKEIGDEYIAKLIQKYQVETYQPVTLLKRLTEDLFYKYKYEPKAGRDLAWKCWIASSDGIEICARDFKKKGAMCKVAIKALAQLL